MVRIGIKNLLFVLTRRWTKGHLFKVWSDCQYCAFKRAWHLSRASGLAISFPICALHFIHSGLMSCSCNLVCMDKPSLWHLGLLQNTEPWPEAWNERTCRSPRFSLTFQSAVSHWLTVAVLNMHRSFFPVHAQMHLLCVAKNIFVSFYLVLFELAVKLLADKSQYENCSSTDLVPSPSGHHEMWFYLESIPEPHKE